MKHDDLLVEIHTEELPPKSLLRLAECFHAEIISRLKKAELAFDSSEYLATPRRLAVIVKKLAATQPDQVVERKGPALAAAFDKTGTPTPACAGFAKSCGISPSELKTIKTPQGEWVAYTQSVTGKPIAEFLPALIEEAALALPIPKRMRWGDSTVQFIRPVHSVILMHGKNILPGTFLGCETSNLTRGHRFLAPKWIKITAPKNYVDILEKNFVLVDIKNRRNKIRAEANALVKSKLNDHCGVGYTDALLDEVTGLVEWPISLYGTFDNQYLKLPEEVLISSMSDHQRYFHVTDDKHLLPHFVTISNIPSNDPARVIHGNERVLRARLSDAAFFYDQDQKERLVSRVEKLKGVVYQAKLGTLYDKAERLSQLSAFVAEQLQYTGKVEKAARAGLLAKADLTTGMVGEFPELQGIMGAYYAKHDGEDDEVVTAIRRQYEIPARSELVALTLALADRIDLLVGSFGINQLPTGDKDPYGLRRAAIGILRILIDNQLDLDLKIVFEKAEKLYQVKLENAALVPQLLLFIQERLRAWYQDKQITADIFASVAALQITNPLDVDKRINAVQAFTKLKEAEALSAANKRVSNILAKFTEKMNSDKLNEALFENDAEKILAKCLLEKENSTFQSYTNRQYQAVLTELADLREPVDNFFDKVMVMTEDQPKRHNRILLLQKLRHLFSQVADIALLQ